MKMKTTLLMCLLLVSGVNGNIAGSNPSNGACLCISGSGVNIRGAACGGVIGSESSGKCYRYSGSKNTCSLGGTNYEFFGFDYGGRSGWAAGNYLDLADNSRCGGGGESSGPGNGVCLCLTGNGVNIRSSACGGVIGTANSGQCYKAKGSKNTCSLGGQSYEFLEFDFGGRAGWAAQNYLSVSPDSKCGTPEPGGRGTISDSCLQCMRKIEGGQIGRCDWDVYSYSCGPYQIKQEYWSEGGRLGGDWQTCAKQEVCSQNTVRGYMRRYGPGCGSNPTCESYLRLHNGGPSGCKVGTKMHTATNVYWNKAKRLCGL